MDNRGQQSANRDRRQNEPHHNLRQGPPMPLLGMRPQLGFYFNPNQNPGPGLQHQFYHPQYRPPPRHHHPGYSNSYVQQQQQGFYRTQPSEQRVLQNNIPSRHAPLAHSREVCSSSHCPPNLNQPQELRLSPETEMNIKEAAAQRLSGFSERREPQEQNVPPLMAIPQDLSFSSTRRSFEHIATTRHENQERKISHPSPSATTHSGTSQSVTPTNPAQCHGGEKTTSKGVIRMATASFNVHGSGRSPMTASLPEVSHPQRSLAQQSCLQSNLLKSIESPKRSLPSQSLPQEEPPPKRASIEILDNAPALQESATDRAENLNDQKWGWEGGAAEAASSATPAAVTHTPKRSRSIIEAVIMESLGMAEPPPDAAVNQFRPKTKTMNPSDLNRKSPLAVQAADQTGDNQEINCGALNEAKAESGEKKSNSELVAAEKVDFFVSTTKDTLLAAMKEAVALPSMETTKCLSNSGGSSTTTSALTLEPTQEKDTPQSSIVVDSERENVSNVAATEPKPLPIPSTLESTPVKSTTAKSSCAERISPRNHTSSVSKRKCDKCKEDLAEGYDSRTCSDCKSKKSAKKSQVPACKHCGFANLVRLNFHSRGKMCMGCKKTFPCPGVYIRHKQSGCCTPAVGADLKIKSTEDLEQSDDPKEKSRENSPPQEVTGISQLILEPRPSLEGGEPEFNVDDIPHQSDPKENDESVTAASEKTLVGPIATKSQVHKRNGIDPVNANFDVMLNADVATSSMPRTETPDPPQEENVSGAEEQNNSAPILPEEERTCQFCEKSIKGKEAAFQWHQLKRKCNICDNVTNCFALHTRHSDFNHQKMLSCFFCNRVFKKRESLRAHQVSECIKCDIRFPCQTKYEDHVKSGHQKPSSDGEIVSADDDSDSDWEVPSTSSKLHDETRRSSCTHCSKIISKNMSDHLKRKECKLCSKVLLCSGQSVKHMRKEHVQCKCRRHLKNKAMLQQHMKDNKCPSCDRTFGCATVVTQHLRMSSRCNEKTQNPGPSNQSSDRKKPRITFSSESSCGNSEIEDSDSNATSKCDFCDQDVNRDAMSAHKRNVRCKVCDDIFVCTGSLLKHRVQEHAQCQFCSKVVANNSQLQLHQQETKCKKRKKDFACAARLQTHSSKSSSCKEVAENCGFCNKKFTSSGDLAQHLSENICPDCLKKFQCHTRLKQHQNLSQQCLGDGTKLKCTVCHRTFKTLQATKEHRSKQTCPMCNGDFSCRSAMDRHLLDCKPKDPVKTPIILKISKSKFKCQHCNLGVSSQQDLDTHLLPLRCNNCREPQLCYRLLTEHIKNCTAPCKWTCNTCNRLFSSQQVLAKHVKKHHSHNCNQCRKSCSSSADLEKHKRRRHPTDQKELEEETSTDSSDEEQIAKNPSEDAPEVPCDDAEEFVPCEQEDSSDQVDVLLGLPEEAAVGPRVGSAVQLSEEAVADDQTERMTLADMSQKATAETPPAGAAEHGGEGANNLADEGETRAENNVHLLEKFLGPSLTKKETDAYLDDDENTSEEDEDELEMAEVLRQEADLAISNVRSLNAALAPKWEDVNLISESEDEIEILEVIDNRSKQ